MEFIKLSIHKEEAHLSSLKPSIDFSSIFSRARRKIKVLKIEEGIRQIDNFSLSFFPHVKVLFLPSTLKFISFADFHHLEDLEKISIPLSNPSLTSGPKGEYLYQKKERSLFYSQGEIPEDCLTIKEIGITSKTLESLTIPSSVEEMYPYTIVNSPLLKEVTFLGDLSAEPFLLGTLFFATPSLKRCYFSRDAVSFLEFCKDQIGKTPIQYFVSEENPDYASYHGSLIQKKSRTLVFGGGNPKIPEGIEKIASHAYYKDKSLTNIHLPKSLRIIGEEAFADTKIRHLFLPKNVERIGERAFAIPTLETIEVDKENPTFTDYSSHIIMRKDTHDVIVGAKKTIFSSGIEGIRSDAFYKNTPKDLLFPYGLSELEVDAIQFPRKIRTLSLPHDNYASLFPFLTHPSSLEEVFVPKDSLPHHLKEKHEEEETWYWGIEDLSSADVIKVENGHPLFDSREQCGGIIETSTNTLLVGSNHFLFPSSLHKIGKKAFYGNKKKIEIELPSSIEAIGEASFSHMINLKRVVIPGTCKRIGKYAFAGDEKLEEVLLEEGIEEIEDGAFAGCFAIKKLTLPSSLKKIGSGAFADLIHLEKISIQNSPYFEVHEGYGVLLRKKDNAVVAAFGNGKIPEGTKKILSNAFSSGLPFEKIVVPNSVYEIKPLSFRALRAKEVLLSSNLTIIPEAAFLYMEVRKLTLPTAIREIHQSAFWNSKLREITLSPHLELIKEDAFKACRYLRKVHSLPEGCFISYDAFDESFLKKNLDVFSHSQFF